MAPFTVSSADAATGVASSVRSECSKIRPMIPAGMVATTSSQARRSSVVSTRRVRSDRKNPAMMRTQSARKYQSSASAVATCSPTRNAR